MIFSLKQLAIITGQHKQTLWQPQIEIHNDTQEYTTKENHQVTMGETNRKRSEQKKATKANRKQVIKW